MEGASFERAPQNGGILCSIGGRRDHCCSGVTEELRFKCVPHVVLVLADGELDTPMSILLILFGHAILLGQRMQFLNIVYRSHWFRIRLVIE